jgi:hypothetical protein
MDGKVVDRESKDDVGGVLEASVSGEKVLEEQEEDVSSIEFAVELLQRDVVDAVNVESHEDADELEGIKDLMGGDISGDGVDSR